MKPSLYPGDLVFIKKFHNKDYKPYDIIISKQNNKLIAHRLILKIDTVSNSYYLCKGDALKRYDKLIPENQILAKVTRIKKQNRIFWPESITEIKQNPFPIYTRWYLKELVYFGILPCS